MNSGPYREPAPGAPEAPDPAFIKCVHCGDLLARKCPRCSEDFRVLFWEKSPGSSAQGVPSTSLIFCPKDPHAKCCDPPPEEHVCLRCVVDPIKDDA